MSRKIQTPPPHLREASPKDIPALAEHHKKIFIEIWELKGDHLDPTRGKELAKAYAQKLASELEAGTCKAWVVEDKDDIVASGAMTLVNLVPTPSNISTTAAYLHSIYTEKPHRRKKYAQRIVHSAVNYCKAKGITFAFLHASSQGEPVYQKIGFSPASDMMKLIIE
ncbi:MAG: GNAT family N-acetyltransferase [Candidatus Electrothrix sp. ATG2]|nr:GNAT family N-acetyltransferase [Candidatus Electrothrix sp. ATG2]